MEYTELYCLFSEAKGELCRAKQEIAAIKAGKWLGKWIRSDHEKVVNNEPTWRRDAMQGRHGTIIFCNSDKKWVVSASTPLSEIRAFDSADEAKKAVDTHFISNGWWLEEA